MFHQFLLLHKYIQNKCLVSHLQNRDPLSDLPLSLTSHAEAQKKTPIQNRTPRKTCATSLNLDRVIGTPILQYQRLVGSRTKL